MPKKVEAPKVEVMKKDWHLSWTLWFNIAIIVATSVNEILQIVPVPASVALVTTAILNMLLRVKTALPIK